jgi:hypothetical protein
MAIYPAYCPRERRTAMSTDTQLAGFMKTRGDLRAEMPASRSSFRRLDLIYYRDPGLKEGQSFPLWTIQ